MDDSSAHISAAPHLDSTPYLHSTPHLQSTPHLSPELLPALQAVSLHDYEELVASRASFVDFLLGSGRAAA